MMDEAESVRKPGTSAQMVGPEQLKNNAFEKAVESVCQHTSYQKFTTFPFEH